MAASDSAEVLAQLPFERKVLVSDVHDDGSELWYRVMFNHFRRVTGQYVFGWLPKTVAGEETLRVTEPSCPDGTSVPEMQVADFERLRCFGDSEVTVRGYATQTQLGGVPVGYDVSPRWLSIDRTVTINGRRPASSGESGAIRVNVDPASGLEIPLDSWVEVTGAFDHEAAADCTRSPTTEDLPVQSVSEQILWCRQRFVVSAVERVSGP